MRARHGPLDDRIALPNVFKRLKDRVLGFKRDTVLALPLEVADPDDDARKFVGVGVQLDAPELPRVNAMRQARDAPVRADRENLPLKFFQQGEADVEEIAATARPDRALAPFRACRGMLVAAQLPSPAAR